MHALCPKLPAAFTTRARLRLPPSLKVQCVSDDIAASLIAPLFNRLASLVVAHGAPLLLAIFLTFHTGASWPLYFLVADLAILLARILIVLWVRRKGAISPDELLRVARPYFVVGIAWSMLTGTFCYLCLTVHGDEASRLLASTLALGIVGGISSRNAATPRFAIAQISMIVLPQILGAAMMGSWWRLQLIQLVIYFVAVCSIVKRNYHDIRSMKNAERENAALAARLDAALGNMSQGLTLYDAKGVLQVVNPQFHEILGLPAETIRPGDASDDVAAKLQEWAISDAVTEAAWSRAGGSGQAILDLPDGRSVMLSREVLSDGGWVTTYEDITEKRRREEQIVHTAHHDGLTGLPNRTTFLNCLRQAVSKLEQGTPFAVIYLDLDRFKQVNDGFGHAVGDRLLVAVAGRLRSCLREHDVIARLGGDEFAILLPRADSAKQVAAIAGRLVTDISDEYRIDGHAVSIGASIGIALAPHDGDSADHLLRHADMALYAAKDAGRGNHQFFDPDMANRLEARRILETDLRHALERHELELYYQPLVSMQTRKVVAFEALLRWHHPERGLVSPVEFIPIAEASGLIVPIGEWVLRTACIQAAGWPEPVRVAVNLSPAQLDGCDMLAIVEDALLQSGLPAFRLEIEITEAVVLKDGEETRNLLRRLHALGVRIALDDFGTGYSSLAYLRALPLNKIKIDRSFVRDLEGSDTGIAIVRAITTLGASLGLATTAEGVETEAQLTQLRALGCTEAQGYLFGRPRPGAEVPQVLRTLGGTQAGSGHQPADRIPEIA